MISLSLKLTTLDSKSCHRYISSSKKQTMKGHLTEIKALIADANLSEAFERIKEVFVESKSYQDVILLQSQFKAAQKKENNGLATPEETRIVVNQITNSLLEWLKSIEESDSLLLQKDENEKTSRLKETIMLVVVILILFGVIFVDRYSLLAPENLFLNFISRIVYWVVGFILGFFYLESSLGIINGGGFDKSVFSHKDKLTNNLNFSIYASVIFGITYFVSNNVLNAAAITLTFFVSGGIFGVSVLCITGVFSGFSKDFREIFESVFPRVFLFAVTSIILSSLKHPLTIRLFTNIDYGLSCVWSFFSNLF